MRMAALPLALIVLGAPLAAQHRPGASPPAAAAPAAGPGEMMMAQMMAHMDSSMAAVMTDIMRFQPRHVLAAAEVLALSPEQVRQLEHLAGSRDATSHEAMHGAGWTAVGQALSAPRPDTAAVRQAAEQVVSHMASMHVAMAVDAAAVKALLRPDQREKVPARQAGGMMMMERGASGGHHHDGH